MATIGTAPRGRPCVTVDGGMMGSRTFLGQYPLQLNGKGEAPYIAALANQCRGIAEVSVVIGRIDVVTETHAFEVEPARSWSEGARQAFAYGGMTGLIPGLALFGEFDCLPLYMKIRNKLPPLELWRWQHGQWEHVSSRRIASRHTAFIDLHNP